MGMALRKNHFATDESAPHAAFGSSLEELNIVVIDNSRTMQTILRSMLQPLRARRVRIYDTAADALREMLIEPPNLILTDWVMMPTSGYRLLRIIRHRSMAPLCFVPVVVVTGHATRSAVESAFRMGAHSVMVKPLSPHAMRRRVEWLIHDARPFRLQNGSYIIDGVAEVLDAQRAKERLPAIIAELRASDSLGDHAATEELIEKIMTGELDEIDLPEFTPATEPKRLRASPESSPTLHRLLRRRAAAPPKEPPAPVSREPIELQTGKKSKKTKGRTRWQDLWSS